MPAGRPNCLICTCEGSMPLDGERLGRAVDANTPLIAHHQLCRAQLGELQQAIADGGDLLIACQQEATLFAEFAGADEQPPNLKTVDIRHAAGWSKEASEALPKMAALLAQAAMPSPDVSTISMESQGRCLIIGHADHVIPAADRLAGLLEITALIEEGEPLASTRRDITLLRGRISRLSGHLGQFGAVLEQVSMPKPSARGTLTFEAPRPQLDAEFDCILDLRGASPLVTAPDKRDGYLRADPRDLLAIERAIFDAAQFTGRFEKPRYVIFDEHLCAHSRSKRVGCQRCLDHCPTGAMSPAGDYVAIDPFVCAGCGSCAALCPSGAITYNNPSPNHLLDRLRVLTASYAAAGGEKAQILVHDHRHGEPLIEAMARFGDGLPAQVIPFAVDEVTQLSLEVIIGAMAYGAVTIDCVIPVQADPEALALRANLDYANAILGGLGYDPRSARLLTLDDPDALAAALWDRPTKRHECRAGFLPLGGKRERLRQGLDALHAAAPAPVDMVTLPEAAPLGNLRIDVDGCTLCLACVGACPTGALTDNEDAPMLRFLEDACIQCGLCANTCPERVIKLEPRVNFLSEAKSPRLIKEEEPARCTRCDKAFGVKSSIDRIVDQLAAKHSMFQSEAQIARLLMCEDCRVVVQFEVPDNPMQGGPKPRTKTTDDYLRERQEIEAARRRLDPKS